MKSIWKWTMTFLLFLFLVVYSENASACGYSPMGMEDVSSQNGFFLTHKEECKAEFRNYFVSEKVQCFKSPESETTLSALPKGSYITIQCTYQTAWEKWGLLGRGSDLKMYSGWVKMSEVEFVYDVVAFLYDHGKDCIDDRSELDWDKICKAPVKESIIWSYPYSGKIIGRQSNGKYLDADYMKIHYYPGILYRDDEGRYWITVSVKRMVYSSEEKNLEKEEYLSGMICLSEPENVNLEKRVMEPYSLPSAGGWAQAIVEKVYIGLSVIVVAIGILFVTVKRRKGKGVTKHVGKFR